MNGTKMQIKEIEEFKNHLKYQLNYSDKTATSYEEDISSFPEPTHGA